MHSFENGNSPLKLIQLNISVFIKMHDVFIEAGGCHLVPLPSSRVCLLGLQTFLNSSQGTVRHIPRQASTPIAANHWASLRPKSATGQWRLRKYPRDHSPTILAPSETSEVDNYNSDTKFRSRFKCWPTL